MEKVESLYYLHFTCLKPKFEIYKIYIYLKKTNKKKSIRNLILSGRPKNISELFIKS